MLVISGKDRGKKGKVLRVEPAGMRVVVEGVNVARKHMRPSRKVMQGGIINQEMPLSSSNVMLVCPRCGKPTRISKRELADGTRVRACRRCGEVIDK